MSKNEYIFNYNKKILENVNQDLIGLMNLYKGIYFKKGKSVKGIGFIKPNKTTKVLDTEKFEELINIYSSKCHPIQLNKEDEYELQNENDFPNIFRDLDVIIDSLIGLNIINFKNKENFKILEPLYLTNYLINYTSSINPFDRDLHIFDEDAFEKFKEKLRNEFIDGVKIIKNGENKSYDLMQILLDLKSINGLFWEFCTIRKIFEDVGHSISFTRILQNFANKLESIHRKLKNKYRKIQPPLITAIASTGGLAKARNYRKRMNPIFEEVFCLFKNNNPTNGKKWKSKNECVNYYIKNFYKENPDTEIDLDSKKLVQEITNRINSIIC